MASIVDRPAVKPDCSSALVNCVESGMLRDRPFGGVMTVINKNLRKKHYNNSL